jgi:hypothetical protein
MSNATNRITFDQFPSVSDADLDQLPLYQLYDLQDEIKEIKTEIAEAAKRLTAAVLRRCEAPGRAALRAKGKDTGSLTLPGDGEYAFKFEIPKKVEWQQTQLRAVVDALAAEGKPVEEYVKIIVEVPEAKYNSWPSDIRTRFDGARMVKDMALKAEIVAEKKK